MCNYKTVETCTYPYVRLCVRVCVCFNSVVIFIGIGSVGVKEKTKTL